ncbi:MAG: sulfite dehydrogenase [Gammaproteobacteria bacterium]|nr:sulfite dehydrogenase [Gammaproteobacteria bacterium]NDE55770.1 sulfite dehydrogenase [Gammaproteobacteria bacterium]NDG87142.1 sulfite dehydrogenase [Gammaproteobacteria bacterium]
MSPTPTRPSDDLVPVAGGGLLDRRMFLRQGMMLGGAGLGLLAVDADAADFSRWMKTPGGPLTNYGEPSPYEKEAIRWISANAKAPGHGISWTPLHRLEGTITPNGLHFERHHNGVPAIDPEQHRLTLHGLFSKPIQWSLEQLFRYPMVSRQCFVECGGNSNAGWHDEPIQTPVGYFHGLVSSSEWTGIPLSTLLDEAGLQPEARWLVAEGADAGAMNVSIPIEKALDDTLLALYQNGERIRPEQGYPMRLILPGFEAVLNVKWLQRLQAVREPLMSRNETAKYTELEPSGKARQFTFIMEAKSVITQPSPGFRLKGPGLYQISGLAWSGRGTIRRVDISADGGRSWAPAALQEPLLSKCFTRFRLPWRWDGSPLILKSRAIDDTGYQQPERSTLIAERGQRGYFHYNAIVAFAVDSDGSLRHVYA